MSQVFRAVSPFAFTDNRGVPRVVTVGTLVADDDEAYVGRGKYFEPVEVAAARFAGVEEATAEPGALRSVTAPPRKRGRPPKNPEPVTVTEESQP